MGFIARHRSLNENRSLVLCRAVVARISKATPRTRGEITSQQTRYIAPLLVECWVNVEDGGPTLGQCIVFVGLGGANTAFTCKVNRYTAFWLCTAENMLE